MITEMIIASVIAGSSVCSDHFDNSQNRFNPSDLDTYQQCVTIVNDIDYGTVGNYLWIRTGEGADSVFTYVAHRDLENKSRADAIELIQGKVVSNVVVDQLNAEIVVLEGEIETLTEQLDAANADLMTANAEVTRLTMELATAITERNTAQAEVTRLTGELATATTNLNNANAMVTSLTTERNNLQTRINGIEAYKTQVAMDSFTVPTTGTNYDNTPTRGDGYAPYGTDGTEVPAPGMSDNPTAVTVTAVEVDTGVAPNTDVLNTNGFTVVTPSQQTLDEIAAGARPPSFAQNAYYIGTLQVTETVFNSVLAAVQGIVDRAVEAAYAEGFHDGYLAGYADGYDDGYQDGYDAGYADGFKDGVASVQ